MWILLTIPFLVQSVAIGLDELVFHVKRGLPKWERIGHPIDTLSVVACFIFVLSTPYSQQALYYYIALALLSCILVTKDEFVHKHHCPAMEHWLHALLFINHPIILAALGLLWHQNLYRGFIISQLVMISLFCLYQIIYWNFIYVPQENKQ